MCYFYCNLTKTIFIWHMTNKLSEWHNQFIIYLFIAVERFHRTLRARIARYCYHKNTMKYIDVLQDLLANYNKSYHRSIKMRPVDVNETTEHVAFENLYRDKTKPKVVPFKYKVNTVESYNKQIIIPDIYVTKPFLLLT